MESQDSSFGDLLIDDAEEFSVSSEELAKAEEMLGCSEREESTRNSEKEAKAKISTVSEEMKVNASNMRKEVTVSDGIKKNYNLKDDFLPLDVVKSAATFTFGKAFNSSSISTGSTASPGFFLERSSSKLGSGFTRRTIPGLSTAPRTAVRPMLQEASEPPSQKDKFTFGKPMNKTTSRDPRFKEPVKTQVETETSVNESAGSQAAVPKKEQTSSVRAKISFEEEKSGGFSGRDQGSIKRTVRNDVKGPSQWSKDSRATMSPSPSLAVKGDLQLQEVERMAQAQREKYNEEREKKELLERLIALKKGQQPKTQSLLKEEENSKRRQEKDVQLLHAKIQQLETEKKVLELQAQVERLSREQQRKGPVKGRIGVKGRLGEFRKRGHEEAGEGGLAYCSEQFRAGLAKQSRQEEKSGDSWLEFQVPAHMSINEQEKELEVWLEQNRPSRVKRSQGVAWLAVQTRAREEKVLEVRNEWEEFEGVRSLEVVHRLAQDWGVLGGKWMGHLPREEIDGVWSKVAAALVAGRLGPQVFMVKVSPVEDVQTLQPTKTHVMIVYNNDYTNEDQVIAVENSLRSAGVTTDLSYKPNIFSSLEIYRNNKWGFRPTIYTSQYLGQGRSRVERVGSGMDRQEGRKYRNMKLPEELVLTEITEQGPVKKENYRKAEDSEVEEEVQDKDFEGDESRSTTSRRRHW